MSNDLTPATAELVFVDWEDIVMDDKWNDDNEEVQPRECTTTGWKISEDAACIRVASTYNWHDQEWATVHTFSKAEPVVKKTGGKYE